MDQWEAIREYVPAEELKGTTEQGGRPWREPRDVVNAILWVLRTGRASATKIMAVADRHALPVAIGIASGQRNEVTLVQETLDAVSRRSSRKG